MRSKENCQSEVIMAWVYSVIQTMDELPEGGGMEVLEIMSLKLIDGIHLEKGEIPLSADEYVDIYDVPIAVYNLSESDKELMKLNSEIKMLSSEFQKLLHYIAQDHDPKIICESLGYEDVTVFWEKRKECLKEFLGKEGDLDDSTKNKILAIFERNIKIRDKFLWNTDVIQKGQKKRKNKKRWMYSGIMAIVIIPLFFIFAYPKFIQKDFQTLFDYGVEKSEFVMTIDSTALLDDMIFEAEEFSPDYHWLLSLKALQDGDSQACRDQLKALKSIDRDLFNRQGKYIYKRLKR